MKAIRAFWKIAAGCVSALMCTTVLSQDLVVAQVAPFSGGIALYSEATHLGAKAYFDSVNAAGGINGAKIRLIKRDDKADAPTTLRLFEEVAQSERPVAFFYPVGPMALDVLHKDEIPQKLEIPVVGSIPGLHKLRTPVNPYVFHIGLGDDQELAKIVEHMATIGLDRLGVVYWDDPQPTEAVKFIESEARKRKLTVTLKAPVPTGTDHIASALQQTLRARPGALITILPVNATALLIKGLREARNYTPVYSPSYAESSVLAGLAGSEHARGAGIAQIVPNPFSRSTQLVREYQDAMKQYAPAGARYSTLSLEGYIAAKLIVEGLRRSGPKPTSKGLKTALEKMQRLDLGGLYASFSPTNHVALRFLDISVVGYDGVLMY